jgi:hypothetical protein
MLDPARLGHDLLVLELMPGDLVPAAVEDHEPGAGRALVNGADEIGHRDLLVVARRRRSAPPRVW